MKTRDTLAMVFGEIFGPDAELSPVDLLSQGAVKAVYRKSSNLTPLLKKMRATISPEQKEDDQQFRAYLASILASLNLKIQQYEVDKYPQPPYQCQFSSVKVNGRLMQVMYVTYDGTPISKEHLAQMTVNSIKLRKYNLIATIFNSMYFSDYYLSLDNSQREQIVNQLIELLSEIEDPQSRKDESPRSQIDRFVDSVVDKIRIITKDSEEDILRNIRNAERYMVADTNSECIVIFESKVRDEDIIQVDIPYANRLTDQQKLEYLKIHNPSISDRPLWFKVLARWEQEWLVSRIPKSLDADWSEFEYIFQSSAMQHVPGIKNARFNYSFAIHHEHPELLAKSVKTSTMVPYEMPLQCHKAETRRTVEQMLMTLQAEAITNMDNVWGDVFRRSGEPVKPLILVQSLLSDTKGGGGDNKLADDQVSAVVSAQSEHQFNDVLIVAGNEAVNFLRAAALQGAKRWGYADSIIQYSRKFITSIGDPAQLSPGQQERLKLIMNLNVELSKLRNPSFNHKVLGIWERNFEEFKVAYLSILVEEMGGVVSTNCKSGKDRTGLDEYYRLAMRIYYRQEGKLPGFADKGIERQKFVNIFVQVFNSMKAQEAAASNTPGSFGIKDDAMMLCKDIAKALGDSFTASNQRAAMNKPQGFTEDEKIQSRQVASLSKEKARTRIESDVSDLYDNTWDEFRQTIEAVLKIIFEKINHEFGYNNSHAEYFKSQLKQFANFAEHKPVNQEERMLAARIFDILAHLGEMNNLQEMHVFLKELYDKDSSLTKSASRTLSGAVLPNVNPVAPVDLMPGVETKTSMSKRKLPKDFESDKLRASKPQRSFRKKPLSPFNVSVTNLLSSIDDLSKSQSQVKRDMPDAKAGPRILPQQAVPHGLITQSTLKLTLSASGLPRVDSVVPHRVEGSQTPILATETDKSLREDKDVGLDASVIERSQQISDTNITLREGTVRQEEQSLEDERRLEKERRREEERREIPLSESMEGVTTVTDTRPRDTSETLERQIKEVVFIMDEIINVLNDVNSDMDKMLKSLGIPEIPNDRANVHAESFTLFPQRTQVAKETVRSGTKNTKDENDEGESEESPSSPFSPDNPIVH
jgi:hypothetical protein